MNDPHRCLQHTPVILCIGTLPESIYLVLQLLNLTFYFANYSPIVAYLSLYYRQTLEIAFDLCS